MAKVSKNQTINLGNVVDTEQLGFLLFPLSVDSKGLCRGCLRITCRFLKQRAIAQRGDICMEIVNRLWGPQMRDIPELLEGGSVP